MNARNLAVSTHPQAVAPAAGIVRQDSQARRCLPEQSSLRGMAAWVGRVPGVSITGLT